MVRNQIAVEIEQADPSLKELASVVVSSSIDAMGIMDRYGQLRQYLALEHPDRRLVGPTRNVQVTHAKLYGHLMLVSLGKEIVAINTLALDTVGGMEVLWRKTLAAQVPGASSRAHRLGAKSAMMPWGTRRYTATHQDGKPVGSLGTVTDRGICYQVGRELRCVDPLTNQPLWIRSGITHGSAVFGDDQYVLVVAPGESNARVFGRIDGQELEPRPVPADSQRWTTQGRNVLVWDQSSRPDLPIRVRLFDPCAQRDLWSLDFAAGAKGWIVPGEAVGVMQPDGRFCLVSLRDGRKIVDAELRPEDKLASIWVLSGPDHYLLVTSNPSAASRTSIMGMTNRIFSRHVNGRIYRIDRQTGQLQWPEPAVVEDYVMPPGQPPDIPLLAFLKESRITENGRTRRRYSLLCLDKRDGRALLDQQHAASNISRFELTADPEQKQVTLQVDSATAFRFQFTDQPRPPRPPGGAEEAATRKKNGLSTGLSKVAEAIVEVLGRQAQRWQQAAQGNAPRPAPVPANNRPANNGPEQAAPEGQ
jgi:hypothetical protein